MASAKKYAAKKKAKKKQLTGEALKTFKAKKKEWAHKWYIKNKKAILKQQKEYKEKIQNGEIVVQHKSTSAKHKELLRKKDRDRKRKKHQTKAEADRLKRIEEYYKPYGK
jgi:hypothetical protein